MSTKSGQGHSSVPGAGQGRSGAGLIPDSEASRGVALPKEGTSFGPYRLDAILGQGGHGVVYRAWDTRLQRQVALKILLRRTIRARERFLREARALAALSHPGIVAVHDLGERDGLAFVVTEFVEGQALDKREPGDLAPRQAAVLMRDVAIAAHHAHTHQIVHRDIKPSNVLIDRAGSVFLVDFGIAALQDTVSNPGITNTGVPIGTPAFMAPEQVGGQSDARSDVYGVGATLLWLLIGIAPGAVPEWDELPQAQELPRNLRTVLRNALAKDVEARYASAADLARALDVVARSGSSGVKRALVGVVAVAALAVGVAFAGGWIGGEQAAPATSDTTPALSPADRLEQLETRAESADWLTLQTELERLRAEVADDPLLRERLESLITDLRWRDARDEAVRLDREGDSLERVLESLKLAQSLKPDEGETGPEALLALLLRRGAAAEALDFARGLEQEPRVQWGQVRALVTLGDVEQALAACRRLQDHPDPWPAIARGERAALLGAHDLGSEEAQAALGVDPTLLSARLLRARCALAEGDTKRALKLAQDLADPRDPRPELLRAGAMRGDPDFAARRACLQRAEALYAEHAPLELGLLRLELELESKSDDAAAAAKGLVSSRDPRALLLRGAAVAEVDPQIARQLWARAYARDAFLVEATLEEIPWLPAEAVRDAAQITAPPRAKYSPYELPRFDGVAAAAEPSVHLAVQRAAEGGPWSQIKAHLDEALKIAPRDLGVARCVAELEVGRGRFTTSLDSIERALELGADRGWGSYLKAEVLNRHVSPERSRAELEQTLTIAKGTWLELAKGERLWQSNDMLAAEAAFQHVLNEHPGHVRALLGRAVCSIRTGRLDVARELTDSLIARRGAIDARVIMMRAIVSSQSLSAETPLNERLNVLYRFEHLRRLTGGSSGRQIAAHYALAHRDTHPWAERLLNEARAREPKRARTYLLLGLLELKRAEPVQEQVLRYWRHARKLDPNTSIQGSFEQTYREVFAETPDLRSE